MRHLVRIPEESKLRLKIEAQSILGKCIPPTFMDDHTTGLVVGYVQSGKTMSFTTVAALARDNNYQMVIVIGGISVPLFNQSWGRLDRDLRIQERSDHKWRHFQNPAPDEATIQNIHGTLQTWRDPNVPTKFMSAVLITVMKNRKRLDDLIEVLRALRERLDMRNIPVLIVDDEADQAGLNTLVRQGDASATYRRLLMLRGLLPHHSFLQYTATPQAPLLINLIDILSPSFVDVLEPGLDYVGGRQFFLDRPDLIKIIPQGEVPTADHAMTEPPPSLLEAMRLFFLGVASGWHLDEGEGHRSMMVHPSQLIIEHANYFTWVNAIKERWQRVFDELAVNDPDRNELVTEFRNSYQELRRTVADLPTFDDLLKLLPYSIRTTRITQVNSLGSKVEWKKAYSHILVGGQAMDRGFTVEGLTITYMPRGIGTGQADTIQQRARFFGYKRRYLNYCRVYLEQRVRDAYRQYVEHEEDVRNRLIRHRDSGQSLSTWKRAFFLRTDLRPTRRQVLDLDYMQDRYSDEWVAPVSPHYSLEATENNRQVMQDFLRTLNLMPDVGHTYRTPAQRHLVDSAVPLRRAYEDFMTKLVFSRPEDSEMLTGALLQVGAFLESHPDAVCSIYQMSPSEQRRRELDDDGKIKNLFQGEYPVEPIAARGSVYPGDRHIRPPEGLAIQLHNLVLAEENRCVVDQNVPTIAVWIPNEMAADWLVQHQPR